MQRGPIFPDHSYFLFALVSAILFLLAYPLDMLPLKFEEPRRALVATEMLISGNFWVPTINGEFYYNKPPLFNWILAFLFKIFGFHNWVERLPTLLSIVGMALVNFTFFKEKIGRQAALLASLFFVCSGHMLFYFSFQGEIDLTYSFVVFLQVVAIFHFFDKKEWFKLFLVSYGLMTIGFLMKGLPSIAFQGITLLAIFGWHKQFKLLFHPAHFLAFGIAGVLLYAYFFQYGKYNDPELLIAKLTVESARRTSENNGLLTYLLQLAKFPLLLLMITLPGSVFLLLLKKAKWQKLKSNRWLIYVLVFLLSNILLYWISPGSRDRYLYMFLPFIYNLIFFLAGDLDSESKLPKITVLGFLGLVALALLSLPFLQDVSWLWVLVATAILILVFVFLQRGSIHYAFAVILLMLTARLFYNQVVFPIRTQSADNIAATEHAEKVVELTDGKPLVFLGGSEEMQLALPFREEVTIKEIERLPYQFSYYYSSKTGKIIQWVDKNVPEGTFYITSKSSADPLYSFQMEGKEWLLFRAN